MGRSYNFQTMLAILRMLDGGETINRDSLADRFRVTSRSIDRYIEA